MAYLTMQDPAARSRIIDVLERNGWAIIPQPTGFHLIQALAGVIEDQQPWLQPAMIVIDAWARGTAGTTIAAGLRDLGIAIPIVLVTAAGEALPVSPDDTLRIVDAANAARVVEELAHRPIRLDDAA